MERFIIRDYEGERESELIRMSVLYEDGDGVDAKKHKNNFEQF